MRYIFLFLIFQGSLVGAEGQMSKGIEALNSGMLKTSKTIFKAEFQDQANKAKACYYLGEVYRLTANPDSADWYFSAGMADPYNDGLCMAGKAGLLMKSQAEQAEDLIKKAQRDKRYKNDPALLVAVARAYLENNQFKAAHECIDKAKLVNEKYPDLYLAEGDVLMAEEPSNAGNAVTKYETAIYFDPAYKPACLKIAHIYQIDGQWDLALQYLDKIATVDSHFPAYLRMKADIEYQQGKYAPAVDLYSEYVKTPEAGFEDHVRYSYALFFNRNFAQSQAEIKNLIQVKPGNLVLKRLLAYNSFETGDFADGLVAMKNFFSVAKPNDFIASDYVYYARLLTKNNQDSLSLVNYMQSLALNPGNAEELYKEITTVAEKTKNYEMSSLYWAKYIKASGKPENSELFFCARDYYFAAGAIDSVAIARNAARAQTKKEYLAKSDSLLAIVISNAPDNFLGYQWRARVNTLIDPTTDQGLAKPYYEQTAQILEKTQKNTAGLLEAYQYLGYYYFLKHDNEQSLMYWNKILSVDPTNTKAQEAVKGLTKKD